MTTTTKRKRAALHASIVRSLNRAGLSDMYGAFYSTDSHRITSFVLRKARAAAKRGEL